MADAVGGGGGLRGGGLEWLGTDGRGGGGGRGGRGGLEALGRLAESLGNFRLGQALFLKEFALGIVRRSLDLLARFMIIG